VRSIALDDEFVNVTLGLFEVARADNVWGDLAQKMDPFKGAGLAAYSYRVDHSCNFYSLWFQLGLFHNIKKYNNPDMKPLENSICYFQLHQGMKSCILGMNIKGGIASDCKFLSADAKLRTNENPQ